MPKATGEVGKDFKEEGKGWRNMFQTDKGHRAAQAAGTFIHLIMIY